jgi:sporulation protein YlmC with PRC-barrel domain
MTPVALPRALRLFPTAVGTILAFLLLLADAGSAGRAQEAGSAPAGEIPTLEGTRDATVPPRRGDAGGAARAPVAPTAMPPAALGTLSSWRAAQDRSAIRIGSEFGADELLGAPVVDREGRAVGTIEDLLVDTDGLVRKAMVRPAPEAAGSRSAVVDLLQLRKRDGGGGGFVVDEAPRGTGPVSPPGPQGGTGAAGTKP